jgi:hypothetical protein
VLCAVHDPLQGCRFLSEATTPGFPAVGLPVDGGSGPCSSRGTLLRCPGPIASPPPHGRVCLGRDVVAAGLLTPDALRSRTWRRLYRGVCADADLPDSFAVRMSGARLLVPPGAVSSGRTAAHLHGAADLVDARTPVEVSVPTGVRFGPVAGLRVRRVRLPTSDVTQVRGRPCTTPLRTALDIARTEPLLEGVVARDVLLARGVVDHPALRSAVRAQPTPRALDGPSAPSTSPTPGRSRRRSRGCGWCSPSPVPSPSPSAPSAIRTVGSWRASTWPSPTDAWRASTTALGTVSRASSHGTGAGSTHSSPQGGRCCT